MPVFTEVGSFKNVSSLVTLPFSFNYLRRQTTSGASLCLTLNCSCLGCSISYGGVWELYGFSSVPKHWFIMEKVDNTTHLQKPTANLFHYLPSLIVFLHFFIFLKDLKIRDMYKKQLDIEMKPTLHCQISMIQRHSYEDLLWNKDTMQWACKYTLS